MEVNLGKIYLSHFDGKQYWNSPLYSGSIKILVGVILRSKHLYSYGGVRSIKWTLRLVSLSTVVKYWASAECIEDTFKDNFRNILSECLEAQKHTEHHTYAAGEMIGSLGVLGVTWTLAGLKK